MGWLKWIKREINNPNNSHKRRQSEPPPNLLMEHHTPSIKEYPRDEAYIKALSKFNEWRIKNKINTTSSAKSNKRQYEKNKRILDKINKNLNNSDKEKLKHFSLTSGNESIVSSLDSENINLKNIYEEIGQNQNFNNKNNEGNDIDFNNDIDSKEKYKSNFKGGRKIKMGSKSLGGKPNKNDMTSMYENDVRNFENDFCLKNMKSAEKPIFNTNNIQSPPIKFYKENSSPFNDSKSPKNCTEECFDLYSSPLKLGSKRKSKLNQRPKSRVTICTIKNCKEHSKTKSSSYQKFDSNISLSNDEFNKNPKSSSNLNSEEVLLNVYKFEDEEEPYNNEVVVNKHGDLVEYTLPNKSEENLNELYSNTVSNNVLNQRLTESQICVDKNFKFLENISSASVFQKDLTDNIQNQGKNVITTDLDQSEDFVPEISKNFNDDIMDELRSLELWSQSLSLIPLNNSKNKKNINSNNSNLNLSGTYSCLLSELKTKISDFRNSFKCPIIFKSGIFRKTSISFLTFDHNADNYDICDAALQKNYLIMRKLRHPNVALLMATCIDKSNEIISLILEPFENTLHDVLYKKNIEIQLNICIEYILQLINAINYIHESKLVHSNISSHSILISEHYKQIKLSSFELTISTNSNNDLFDELKNLENDKKFNKSKISKNILPYFIDYRKVYSQYQYQPPELISMTHKFVFPTVKSDFYGITIVLWEILNSRIPFESHTYEDLEKLYHLNQIKLTMLNKERCKLFEEILRQGLCAEPNERFQNIDIIKFCLEEINVNILSKEMSKVITCDSNEKQPQTESESLLEFSKLLKNRVFGSKEYDRTSTAKKKKNKLPKNNRLSAKELFEDKNTGNNISIKISTKDVSNLKEDNDKVKQQIKTNENLNRSCNFNSQLDSNISKQNNKIKKILLESRKFDAPITGKNKLLSKEFSSPKERLNTESLQTGENNSLKLMDRILKHDISIPDSSENKTVNVRIFITQSFIEENEKLDKNTHIEEEHEKIKIFSPTEINNEKKFVNNANNKTEIGITDQIKFWNNLTLSSYQDFKDQQNVNEEKLLNHKRSKTAPEQVSNFNDKNFQNNVQNIKNLFSTEIFKEKYDQFLTKSKIRDDNFENTLWKREKLKCEQNSPRNNNDNLNSESGVITPGRTSVKETIDKFENYLKHKHSSTIISLQDETYETEGKEITFDANTARLLESQDVVYDVCGNPENEHNDKEKDKDINNCSRNVSVLNVVLKNNKNKNVTDESLSNKKIEKLLMANYENENVIFPLKNLRNQQPILLSLNLKKLVRRASDVGCSSLKIQKRISNVRHSIGGTELKLVSSDVFDETSFLNLNTDSIEENKQIIKRDLNALIETSEKRIGKVKCWNCGCQKFVVDDNSLKDEENLNKKQALIKITDPRQSLGAISQGAKSTEDLYIDDDFDTELGLCANFELGIEEEKLEISDLFDFDIVSAEILKESNVDV